MILIDREIRIALKDRLFEITPLPDLEVAVSSTSIDLRLFDSFKTWKAMPGMTIAPGKPGYSYSKISDLQEGHKGPSNWLPALSSWPGHVSVSQSRSSRVLLLG